MKLKLVGFVLTFLVGTIAFAQEEEGFTDEDLTKFATVMVWAEVEKGKMADSVEFWVKNNETLSASTYNKLSKAADLSTVDATEEEVAIYQEIQTNIEDQKAVFKEVYITKIKEDIGAGLYNKLNKALKGDDADLKTRYQEVYDTLLEEAMPAEEEGESEN